MKPISELPGWVKRICPYIKGPCRQDKCLAFEHVHTTDRKTDWDGTQPPLEIRCKLLDRTFVQYDKEEWDAALEARTKKARKAGA